MKVLVTGCDGYIGSVLVRKLGENGYDVVGLDTCYYKDCKLTESEDVKLIEKDIRDIAKSDLGGIDAIVHLAALSNDPLGHLEPRLTTEINFLASVKLAQLAQRVGVKRFVFASSCSMYGVAADVVTEDSALTPLTEYARSKIESENSISKLLDSSFCAVYLRCATVFGISPKLRFDLVVNNLTGLALTEKKIIVNSDGTPWRPVLHVEDACDAYMLALEADEGLVNGKAYNVGATDENYQIIDIANVVKKETGCEVVMLNKEPDSRSYKVNCDKIKNELGFGVSWPLSKGVSSLVKSLRNLGLDYSDFASKNFTRLRQIEYLISSGKVDSNLRWK